MTANTLMWVNSNGITLDALLRKGRLWVIEPHIPDASARMAIWETACQPGDTIGKLMVRMAAARGIKLPRSIELRSRMFGDAVRNSGAAALVFQDAQLLSNSVLGHMRILSEEIAPVILVGDVLGIGTAIRSDASFMQRARFCVRAMAI